MAQLQKLEQQLEDAKVLIAQRNLALRLSENHDFRKLILDEFCVKEAARYVHASIDSAMTAEQRADALIFAQATGVVKKWLSIQIQMGFAAERDLTDLEAAIEAERAEPSEGE
jgi:hypothetical protein